MTTPSYPVGTARAALRDAVLSFGGVVAVRRPGDDLVEAIARAFGAVVRRHLSAGAGMSSTMGDDSRLRPHPAIAELLDQIGSAPEMQETPATPGRRTTPVFGDDEWLRLPGLFRRWEMEQVIDVDHDFHVEAAGHCEDGTQLFAVYARAHERRNDR